MCAQCEECESSKSDVSHSYQHRECGEKGVRFFDLSYHLSPIQHCRDDSKQEECKPCDAPQAGESSNEDEPDQDKGTDKPGSFQVKAKDTLTC